jgi:hypothetical protein
MSEVTPATSNEIVEMLQSIVLATSQLLSPAERDRITPEESALALSILKTTADTTWKCAEKEALDAMTRNQEAKQRAGDVVPLGEQDQARVLEMIRAETEKVAAETERLRMETLKLKAETEKEIAQKEKLVVEVERVNAETAILRLRIS